MLLLQCVSGVYILQNTMSRGGEMVPAKKESEAVREKKEKGERKREKEKEERKKKQSFS